MKAFLKLVLLAGCVAAAASYFSNHRTAGLTDESAAANDSAVAEFRSINVIDGEEFRFSELNGKPVLLLFCAFHSGANACDSALPFVSQLHERYAKRGLRVVLVMLTEFAIVQFPPEQEDQERMRFSDELDPSEVRHWASTRKIPFPVIIGYRRFAQRYKACNVPHVTFLARQGQVALEGQGLSPGGT